MNYTDYVEVDNAYNNDERELDAYIKLEYNVPMYEDDDTSVITLNLNGLAPEPLDNIDMQYVTDTTLGELEEEIYMQQKDATLEAGYLKLDGTHYFIDKENLTGYISKDIVGSLENNILLFRIDIDGTRINNDVKGMTLYFEDNIPDTITILDRRLENQRIGRVENNTNKTVVIEFTQEFDKTGNNIPLIVRCQNFNRADRRIRLKRIELGLIKTYTKEDIVSMNISETVRKFCTETPENDCDIVLNNIDKDFDVLNENGLVRYLNKDVKITPYIGILTENQGICYDKMGVFYLDEWKNNDDGTVNLNCKNAIVKLKDKNLNFTLDNIEDTTKVGMSLIQDEVYVNNVWNTISNMINFSFNYSRTAVTTDQEWNRTTMDNTFTNLMDYLQNLAFSTGNVFYFDRENRLNIVRPIYIEQNDDSFVYEELSTDNFIKDPEITKLQRPEVIEFIQDSYTVDTSTTQTDKYEIEVGEYDKIVRIDLNTKGVLTPTTLSAYKWGSASAYQILEDDRGNIQANTDMVFMLIKGQGEGHDTEVVTINLTVYPASSNAISTYYDGILRGTDYELKTDNYITLQPKFLGMDICVPGSLVTGNDQAKCLKYYFDYASNYKMRFSYGGNARRTAGQTVKVNLPEYNRSMNIFIEKITFKYDGGLTCDVEGVDVKDGN